MPTWNVAMFAYLRERHGATVAIDAEPLASAILRALADAGVDTRACRLAVGDEFVALDTPVATGADVSLIPPVSGG